MDAVLYGLASEPVILVTPLVEAPPVFGSPVIPGIWIFPIPVIILGPIRDPESKITRYVRAFHREHDWMQKAGTGVTSKLCGSLFHFCGLRTHGDGDQGLSYASSLNFNVLSLSIADEIADDCVACAVASKEDLGIEFTSNFGIVHHWTNFHARGHHFVARHHFVHPSMWASHLSHWWSHVAHHWSHHTGHHTRALRSSHWSHMAHHWWPHSGSHTGALHSSHWSHVSHHWWPHLRFHMRSLSEMLHCSHVHLPFLVTQKWSLSYSLFPGHPLMPSWIHFLLSVRKIATLWGIHNLALFQAHVVSLVTLVTGGMAKFNVTLLTLAVVNHYFIFMPFLIFNCRNKRGIVLVRALPVSILQFSRPRQRTLCKKCHSHIHLYSYAICMSMK